MPLPSGRIGQPIFEPTPTEGATMEYGGTPFNPNQAGMKQASPLPQAPSLLPMTPLPESLPQFTQQESEALKNRFMQQQFPNGNPFSSGGHGSGGLF